MSVFAMIRNMEILPSLEKLHEQALALNIKADRITMVMAFCNWSMVCE